MTVRRLFATLDPAARSRRASDAIAVGVGVAALAALGSAAVPTAGWERAVARFAASLPNSLDTWWRLIADVTVVGAVALVMVAAFARRWFAVIEAALAAVASVVIAAVVHRWVLGAWPAAHVFVDHVPSVRGDLDTRSAIGLAQFPAVRVALALSVLVAISPFLVRSWRRWVWWWVVVASAGCLVDGTTAPTATGAALAVVAVAVGGVRLAVGAPHARPSLAEVAAAVRSLGVDVHDLVVAVDQRVGRFDLDALDVAGRSLRIRIYGADADDTQALRVLGRGLWRRGPIRGLPIGRLAQIEHEAFLTYLVADAGVVTTPVVTAGLAPDGDAVIVLAALPGSSSGGTARTIAHVDAAWRTLATLHDRDVAHGALDGAHLVPVGDAVGIVDFHQATVSTDRTALRTDEAQLLVTTALWAGVGPAVQSARQALGDVGLADVLPYVQAPLLTAAHRSALDAADDVSLDELRTSAAEACGVEVPELLKVQRVTARTFIQLALFGVAFVALSSAVGGVDLSLLAQQVGDGIWWWIAVGLVIAQIARLGSAVSTVGASAKPIPLGPTYVLQLALSYIALAIPGSAARFAVNVRYLQRNGLPPGSAIAVSGLDSFWWFVVQFGTVGVILLATPLSLDVDLSGSSSSGVSRVLAIVVGIGIAALVVLAAVPRWRDPALAWVRQILGEAREAAEGMWTPRRLGMLVGGNFAAEVGLAIALGAMVSSLGYSVGLVELLFINVSVTVLASLLPIPGGVGVIEGGLTLGLMRAGLSDEGALGAALLYRSATFYLPPVWGFFAVRWLERHRLL